jgi:hypothetical protein
MIVDVALDLLHKAEGGRRHSPGFR